MSLWETWKRRINNFGGSRESLSSLASSYVSSSRSSNRGVSSEDSSILRGPPKSPQNLQLGQSTPLERQVGDTDVVNRRQEIPQQSESVNMDVTLHQDKESENDVEEVEHQSEESLHDPPQNTSTPQLRGKNSGQPKDINRQMATIKGIVTRLATDINSFVIRSDSGERILQQKMKKLAEDNTKLERMWQEHVNNLDASLQQREKTNMKMYSDKVKNALAIGGVKLREFYDGREESFDAERWQDILDAPNLDLSSIPGAVGDLPRNQSTESEGEDQRETHDILPVLVHATHFQPAPREENNSRTGSRKSSDHSVSKYLKDDHQIAHKALNPQIREAVQALGIDQTKADFSAEDIEMIVSYCQGNPQKSANPQDSPNPRTNTNRRSSKDIIVSILGNKGNNLLNRPAPRKFQRSAAAIVPDRIDKVSDEGYMPKSTRPKPAVSFGRKERRSSQEDADLKQAIFESRQSYQQHMRNRRQPNVTPKVDSPQDSEIQTMKNEMKELKEMMKQLISVQSQNIVSANSHKEEAPDVTEDPKQPVLPKKQTASRQSYKSYGTEQPDAQLSPSASQKDDPRQTPSDNVNSHQTLLQAPIPHGLTDWSQQTGRRWVNDDKHLPKAEMSKFSGDRLKYPLWRSQMVIMIDQKAISNETKCNLVIQSLEGEALLYGESFLRAGIKPDSYYKLIEMLDEEYGGEDRMREDQLKRLKDYGQIRDFSLQNLKSLNLLFSDEKKFLHEFDPNSVTQRKSMVYLLARDILPDIQLMHFGRWIRDNCLDENFDNLQRWVKREYEAARDMREHTKPYESRVDFSANKIDKKKKIVSSKTFVDEENLEEDPEESEDEVHVTQQKSFRKPTQLPSRPPVPPKQSLCCVCKKPHDLAECPDFIRQTLKQKIETVKANKICFHCLLPGHRVSKCNLFPGRKCGENGCTKYHHRRLHTDRSTTVFTVEEIFDDAYVDPNEVEESQQIHANFAVKGEVSNDLAYLSKHGGYFGIRSAIVWISNGKKTRRILAALDSCSNNTNISADLAEDLGLPVIKDNIPRRINGMRSSVVINSAAVKFSIMPLDRSSKFDIVAYTVEDFMQGTAVVDWSQAVNELTHFEDIEDYPTLWRGAKFELLLGTDYADLMAANKSLKGPRGSAVAELTDLGWAFSGPAPKSCTTHLNTDELYQTSSMTVMLSMSVEDNIDKLMYREWDLDALGMKEEAPNFSNAVKNPKIPWSRKEIEADEKMKTEFLPEEKAYQISIPWKEEKPNFTSNFQQVKNRQDRVVANLERSGTSEEQVNQIFQDYINKGYVRVLSASEMREKDAFYLPWFPVVDKSRETTKCRLVFDAAARDKFDRSLNSEIEVTPNRLNNLFDILLRFRQFQYCMSADVSEMFLRIKLNPDDRRYHRFVFRDTCMEWQVMLFGNQSSPNGSQKVLAQNCIDHGEPYPEAVETILGSTYMDDAIDSRQTEDEMIELVAQLPALLSKCNMKIQKFYSNSRLAMDAIPEELRSKSIIFEDKDIIYEDNKILGMMYSGDDSDTLHFATKFESKTEWQLRKTKVVIRVWTKRLTLRVLASLYDPLGLLSPFKNRAQVLIQKMWRRKVDWDAPLADDLQREWDSWLDGIFELKNVKAPRWLGISSDNKDRQLHVFVDASEEAFAACVYTRIVQCDGTVTTNLVTAKARVTPLKSESISRMELVACVLGTRLARAVLNVLQIDPKNWFMWTDSQVCLHWIITPAKAFKAYVANRCGEIQSCTQQSQWHHVPTDKNPADIATRPITAEELIKSSLWWNGPEFLRQPESEWPKTKLLRLDPLVNLEEKNASTKPNDVSFCTLSEDISLVQSEIMDPLDRMKPENWSVDEKYNGFKRCLTRWYYILEVIRVWKIRSFEKATVRIQKPSPKDYHLVKKFLIRRAQLEWFGNFFDGDRILEGRVPKELQKFKPFVDDDKIVRSNSRLSQIRHLDYDERYPVLLHRKSGYAKLVAWYLHFQLDHPVGHRAFVAKLSSEFAVHGLGTLCQIIKRECSVCRKEKAKAASQEMANLPNFRLEIGCQAFQNTGLDYCGPFHVKVSRGRAKRKVWILVLTCLQIRAVHLEVVTSQDTSAFINALSRFCDVRGVPKFILSDNQTCFRGAEKELQDWLSQVDWEHLEESTGFGWKGSHGIEWKFNPPLAPHFGGIFETIVKATKRGLKTTLEQTDLDEEEFRTAVSHVMYLLNRRPITTLGDCNDDVPLTPNDFLMAHSAGHILPPLPEGAYKLSQKWKVVQKKIEEFWKRFIKEMMASLQPRKYWSQAQRNLNIDDVVLEIDPNLPRGQWRMLRVKELLPSPDGLIRRVVVVNSSGKLYERAIHRLIPIVPN